MISQPFWPAYLTEERIANANKLQIAITAGIGSDHVDLQAAMDRGITVAEVTYCNSISVCILTGQRKGEIGHLEWEWFDRVDRTITLPEWLTKNKRKHIFPYGNLLAALLETLPVMGNARYLFPAAKSHIRGKPTTVFNGWGKAKAEFDAALEGVRPFTLRDLRRTVSSHMAKLGIEQIVVEKLLNHVSGGTQSPIAQVYNQYSYFTEGSTSASMAAAINAILTFSVLHRPIRASTSAANAARNFGSSDGHSPFVRTSLISRKSRTGLCCHFGWRSGLP